MQNIRAYDSERRTVEELRRLSALRADFVSLVSHELRSPMAAVIGAARTLQQRWRELQPEQREAFLALIGDETTRLAALIGDVLDTSRIEAGTFCYSFTRRRRRARSCATRSRRRRSARTRCRSSLDDRASRCRRSAATASGCGRCSANLIENAVKYSPAGDDGRGASVSASERRRARLGQRPRPGHRVATSRR